VRAAAQALGIALALHRCMLNPTLSVLSAALVAALSLASPSARAQAGPLSRLGPCRALRVVDSDSADLRCGPEVVRVRLRNVAAPRPGQVGYTEAVRALAELLRARDLYVASDEPGPVPRDPNGRLLAYLVDPSDANLNVVFVLLGWASYSSDAGPGRFEKSFRAAEQDARADRRALWTVWSVSAEHAPER
jgi:endonuclease YncB( thermonuclease family)